MARLRNSIAALPATEKQQAALGAWHDAWRAWATPAAHLDGPLLLERLEYGAGSRDEVLFGQAVLATVVRDAEGLHRILADGFPSGLPVGEVLREFTHRRRAARGAVQISRHAHAIAELTAQEEGDLDAAHVEGEDRVAAQHELERIGDAARWVAEAADLVAGGLVDVDPRRQGARIDIGARELAGHATALFGHVSDLAERLALMDRATGGTPERLRTVFPALAERVDAVAAGCRRPERDLPHLAGVIHRAGDVYWLKVSDTFWVVGADVERIRAVAAHGDRHGMIFVADDISGVDQARLAEVLADQLGAMPDPPLAVVLAPPIIDADPSWPELQLSFLRGNTTLRVHPQFAGLGRRVRAHLMRLGGTGPVGSPARR
jgi:hypothetical protein